ncbi:MAG: HAD family phosphatase, partial [Acidocella sp.]|nr:HAD family phosphatase [Acidocella sp.]
MRPELIIFDCDGVLVDSESVASAVIAQNLTDLGWKMDAKAAMGVFLGMSIIDMQPMIERHLGRALPSGWRQALAETLRVALSQAVRPIDG